MATKEYDLTKKYYVYFYVREDGSPYYVGKGSGKRCKDRDSHFVKPNKNRTNIIIVKDNLSELRAFTLEKYYIREFGRKDLGTGILHNKTNGGEGTSGWIPTEEYKLNRSDKWTLKTPGGDVIKIENLTGFCRDNNLDQAAMYRVSRKFSIHHKEWRCLKGWELSKEDQKFLDTPIYSEFILSSPCGVLVKSNSLSELKRLYGLDTGNMSRLVSGKTKQHKGWCLL